MLTKTNIIVALGSVSIAFAVFLNGIYSKPDTEIVKQLRVNNEILKEEVKNLYTVLQTQYKIDSLLLLKSPDVK